MAAGPVVHQVDYCRAVSKTGHVVHWVAGVIGHLLPEADEPVSAKATVRLIKALGCDGISKSQVSRICQDWTRWWRTSLADAWTATLTPMCDWALTQKVREDGRIVNVSVVATGVSAVGQLESVRTGEVVENFLGRRLTLTPMCDWALTQKVREDGRS